jgi:His-Xaa-Ser system protein HxsD
MTMIDTQQKIIVEFDSRVWNLTAIKKAAYKYLNTFVCDISLQEHAIRCELGFLPSISEEACAQTIEDFKKEALDQDLRERLKAETESVRNLILAHAFSRTGIIKNEQVSEP